MKRGYAAKIGVRHRAFALKRILSFIGTVGLCGKRSQVQCSRINGSDLPDGWQAGLR